VVAHFHFVLSIGAVFALFSGVYYYFNYLFGPAISVSTHIIITFILCFTVYVLLTFAPLHILGFNTCPRRIPDYRYRVIYI
jgi:cytochrome c oxidase subunit 1